VARNPDVRVFAVLRQPADRAFSSWTAHRRDGLEPLGFEQAVEAEPARIAAGWSPLWWYVERGWYGRHLARWFEVIPAAQRRVWLYEDVTRDAPRFMRELFDFLDVDPAFEPEMDKRHNVSLVPRSHRLSRLVRRPSRTRRALGMVVPRGLRASTASRILSVNERRLTFDPAVRRRLVDQYRPDIEQLARLLDRDLSSWLR
jgi:hypothetical protein